MFKPVHGYPGEKWPNAGPARAPQERRNPQEKLICCNCVFISESVFLVKYNGFELINVILGRYCEKIYGLPCKANLESAIQTRSVRFLCGKIPNREVRIHGQEIHPNPSEIYVNPQETPTTSSRMPPPDPLPPPHHLTPGIWEGVVGSSLWISVDFH